MVLGHISQMATRPLTHPVSLSNLNPASTSACFSITPSTESPNLFDTLIVVPHTIYRQWQDSIESQTTLKTHYLKSLRDLDKDSLIKTLESSHLTLVSNNLLSPFLHNLRAREIKPVWRRIIYDEADSVKIPSSCLRPEAHMTWYVSATYTNLLLANTYYHSYIIRQLPQVFLETLDKELQELVQTHVNNHPTISFFRTQSYAFFQEHLKSQHPLRGYLVIRSTEDFLNKSVQLPPLHQQIIRCQTPLSQRVLESVISPEAETMLHAGDISGALQSLGVSTHSPLTLVAAVSDMKVKELERLKRLIAFKAEETYASAQAKEQALHALQDKITKLEQQIEGITHRVEQASKEACAVCFDAPSSPVMTPCCSKIFCGGCILAWMVRTTACPLCRAQFHPNQLKHISPDAKPTPVAPELPKKIDALLKLLEENPDGKFLIFSRFDNPLQNIYEIISERYSIQTLKGNKDSVAKTIAEFESGKTKILLLNSRIASAGMNIPSATHLILLHKMAVEEEKQILGRAYRLGRTTPLQYIKLLHQKE